METLAAVHIRWMIRKDTPRVLEIEQLSFEFPWTEEDFLRCLRQRNCIGMVAETGPDGGGQVLGFMLYELHARRLEVLNFAVHPACHRSGVGTSMVRTLIAKLSSHRRRSITLNVRDTNTAAQLFFQAHGFRAVHVVRGFYDTGDDAYRMAYFKE